MSLVLAVSLLVGDLLHFDVDHPDAGGVFSLPAIAGFVGAFGFGGAIVAALGGPGGVTVAVLGGRRRRRADRLAGHAASPGWR